MSKNLRLVLHKKISQVLNDEKSSLPKIAASQLTINIEETTRKFFFTLPLRSKYHDIRHKVPDLLENGPDDSIEHVKLSEDSEKLNFFLHRDHYIKGLLESLQHKVIPPDFMCSKADNVVVEFSSPNIAKPFHVGHLRSTMIGNYIANLNNFFSHNVKRINYLGDWGTQFGFVQLGLSLAQVTEETLKKDPITTLYKAYVHANKLAKNDPAIADQAREIFKNLESGDQSNFTEWESFRNYTLQELNRTYNRINVKFDEYEWESMYSIKQISSIINEMNKLDLLSVDGSGRKVIQLNEKRKVPIVKSDGSSLYITRDIAAAIDRFDKYNFDIMYYVVDNAQTDHFMNLFTILNDMQFSWSDRLRHVKFGKIRGMSTRKGTAVFLQDILNETVAVMKQKQIKSPNTKVDLDFNDPSTEVLGISAMIINDLRHKRNQDYEFDWDTALDIKKDSGVKLQYTHCRLCSVEENSGAMVTSECIPSLLPGNAAEDLVLMIGKFDEAVIKSYQELEPYILVNYLFKLSQSTGRALGCLKVKGEPSAIASQRLLLLSTARKVLAEGMKLLGLTPLKQM